MNDQILDYLNHTLDDAARSQFERRLREDTDLREQVARTRRLQRHIAENVRDSIDISEPPASMTFAAIAPRVQRRIPFRQRFSYTFAAFAAVIVLFFAVAYSLPENIREPIEGGVTTAIPTVNVFTIRTITPLTTTLTTEAQNAPSIPSRTPTPDGESLIESPTVATSNSLSTHTPIATEER